MQLVWATFIGRNPVHLFISALLIFNRYIEICPTLLFLSIFLFLSCSKFRSDNQGCRKVLFVLQCIPPANPPTPTSARPFITKRYMQPWTGLFIKNTQRLEHRWQRKGVIDHHFKGNQRSSFCTRSYHFSRRWFEPKDILKSNHASTTTTPKPRGDLFINYVDFLSGYLMLITESRSSKTSFHASLLKTAVLSGPNYETNHDAWN